MEKVRRHIIFSGEVQGVGFRYKAKHTANRYGISGWVRNLWDGSVEMEAEGHPRDIDDLLLALERDSWAEISEIRSESIPLHNDHSFEIKY
jgi:acylphosphatase